MGRRALPKIDPSVDLSQHLLTVDDLQQPFDPQQLFDKRQPLELEVGSGKGHFVLQQSQQNPNRNYLGNEIAFKYARFGAYRLAKNGRSNARMIAGDGLKLFRELLPSHCAEDVHVYFPDPWWKERHRRRRVMQPGFVADIERVLIPGGRFHFWTDVEEYFEETKSLLSDISKMEGPMEVPLRAPEHDMDYQTHFERRMRLNGHDVFRSMYQMPC